MNSNIGISNNKPDHKNIDFLLVNLPFRENPKYQSFHLGLLYVASSLNEGGFSVKVLDDGEMDVESFLYLYKKNRPHVLGFYVNTDAITAIERILDLLHQENEMPDLVIFGGPHVTIEDKKLLEENRGNIVVRGEGEETILEIGRWFLKGEKQLANIAGITYIDENKNIRRNPDRPFIHDLDKLPFPNPELLVKEPRHSSFQMITGRGCPFHCTFCAEGIAGIKYRFRSPESVLEEIKSILGDRERIYLSILDDTFLVDSQRVKAVAQGLIKEYGKSKRIKWFCESRVDFIIKNPDIFPLLKEAGLVRVQIGIESGNQNILDTYRKKVKVKEIIQAVEILRSSNISSIYGNFIIGGPHETDETVQESIDLARKLIEIAPGRMECAASYLTLFPGTELSINPDVYDLDVFDPDLKTCISLQYPTVAPKNKSKYWVIEQYNRFNLEIQNNYHSIMRNIPMELIEEHLNLRDYGINTHMSDIYLNYPCISRCEDMRRRHNSLDNKINDNTEFAKLIPRRSGSLSVKNGRLAIESHPQGEVIFNEIAGKIYELCSGKYRIIEIIGMLRDSHKNLPPEPYFSEQVFSIIKDLKRRYLLFFSDL